MEILPQTIRNSYKMKNIVIVLLIAFAFGQSFGQIDKDPVFNSVSTGEKQFDNFLLISNYYTLENNIENRGSSVFISENPSLEEIEDAAINLPSDFFILTKESKVICMVILNNSPKREFLSIVMRNNLHSNFPTSLIGDITENRANEIVRKGFDPNGIIENGILRFNGKELTIISNQEIEEAVLALIKSEKLDKKRPSNIIMPSQREIADYIIAESQEGRELDFFTEIKGKEYDGVQIKPGVFTTKQSVALYKWGRACFDLGVNTIDDAYAIFMKFKDGHISDRSKEYIRMGFYKEWEKE